IESLATMLSNGSEFISWRLWLLFASQPWPHPTQQELLNLLFTYTEHDIDHSGVISRTTFNERCPWRRCRCGGGFAAADCQPQWTSMC
ncbi:unnamed protein product, partial [Rotaria sordida]